MLTQIPGHPAYFATKDGRVYTICKTGIKEHRYSFSSKGYVYVSLDSKAYLLHRVIYETFNGPIPKGAEVAHLDDVKSNNAIENLAAVSHAENMKQAKRNGRIYTGERVHTAKLTRHKVIQLHAMHQKGQSQTAIAKKLGVSLQAVNHVIKGRTWKHVELPTQLREAA